jgi:Response regulators consisting of a CheY-like receiver domain and a winged-helix DNA-binding domain
MRTILIVDDDKEIANLTSLYLQNEGFRTILRHNGEDALRTLAEEEVSLVVLDVMMPGLDGMAVCRKVREAQNTVPILIVSAKTEDMDKITGLLSGADDYMIKPFNPLELTARVKSLLRRTFQYNSEPSLSSQDALTIHSLYINRDSHKVTFQGEEIALTNREFAILHLLASHPGRVFSSEEIFRLVWKENYYASNNTVMVHISNLREKLEKKMGYKIIQTVWGVGYKIDA